MLKKIRAVIIICCLVSLLGILGYAYLIDQNNTVIDKDDIINNVDNVNTEELNYDYVSSYLKKLGIGNLNAYKLNTIESQLEADFYKDMPSEEEMAKKIVALFLEHFYDSVDLEDKEAVTDAVLKCWFASLGDPYAYYRTTTEYEAYLEDLIGGESFVGIGVMINAETLEILTVYPDSGAAEAGIKPRDIIFGVDGKTVEDTDKTELTDMLRGDEGTTVQVTVKRGDELIEYTVTRKVIVEKSVYYSIDEDNIGVINITQFVQTTSDEFKEAVDYCVESGVDALIIDVRYNPGGLLSSVIEVIDYLVPDSPDRRVTSYTQAGEEYVYYTEDGHSVDLPIAVICNGGTASAGELFTAAMRDYGAEGVLDTVIIGTQTYGKGVVQNSYTLYDYSGITYTIGYYNPPCDVNFDGEGITPEIIVEEVEAIDLPYNTAKAEVIKMIDTKGGMTVSVGMAA